MSAPSPRTGLPLAVIAILMVAPFTAGDARRLAYDDVWYDGIAGSLGSADDRPIGFGTSGPTGNFGNVVPLKPRSGAIRRFQGLIAGTDTVFGGQIPARAYQSIRFRLYDGLPGQGGIQIETHLVELFGDTTPVFANMRSAENYNIYYADILIGPVVIDDLAEPYLLIQWNLDVDDFPFAIGGGVLSPFGPEGFLYDTGTTMPAGAGFFYRLLE